MNREQIINLLASLGNTQAEIAKSCEAKGYKGYTRDACGCPLANCLKSVGCRGVAVSRIDVCTDEVEGDILLTQAQQDFVWAFDDRKYPHLILV